jgi:hypothetical protein
MTSSGLRPIGRSHRAYIARTLKICLRELEALADGRLKWIGDDHIVEVERLSPNSTSAARTAAPMAIPCRIAHGVPVLGRILSTGVVEHDDPWTPEDGARIPVRYPQVPDAFALELKAAAAPHGTGACLVFQLIPPAEFNEGELALLSRGEAEAETGLFRVHHEPPMSLQLLPAMRCVREPVVVATAEILRAARVIGAHGGDM